MKKMRKFFLTVFSLSSCLLMTGAGAQTPAPVSSNQTPSNACYLWKGRGGTPQASYMASHASCRPWNSNYGWSFFKPNNGVDYYRGTFKDALATGSTWAVYADFGSAVVTSKADYDSFVANTKLFGSCATCLK